MRKATPSELYFAQGDFIGLLRDLGDITKFRLTAMVALTVLVGFFLAPGFPSSLRLLLCLSGTTLLVMGACVLNCYLERDLDKKMVRTRGRPLPAGRMSPSFALTISLFLIVFSLVILGFGVNVLTAFLGFLATFLYGFAYTYLKQKSPLSLFVGAIPGAIPPVMGWTSVTNSLALFPLILFVMMFFWQIPHFMAIGLYREDDYRNAGFQIISFERGHSFVRLKIFLYTLVLLFVSLLPFFLGLGGAPYFCITLVLGGGLGFFAFRGLLLRGDGPHQRSWARTYFFGTIIYLPLSFIALFLQRVL